MFEVQVGATDVTIYVLFVDDDGGTAPGEPTTGLAFGNIETGGSASTMREGAARADLTLVTQTVAGAHTDGGFIEVDATNMPGVYRLDLPDVFATGADFVIAMCVAEGTNNSIMRPVVIKILENPSVNVAQYLGSAAPALISSRYPAQVAGMEAGVLTAAAIAANAIEAGKINAAALNGKGDWNIGKTGYTAAPTTGSIVAGSFGAGAIDGPALDATAITKIRSILNGTSDAGGSTTTMVDAALTEIDNVWNGSWIMFTSAGLVNQTRLILDFDAASDTLTFTPAVTETLAAGFTYEILPAGAVDVQSWLGVVGGLVAPNALIAGRMDSNAQAGIAPLGTAMRGTDGVDTATMRGTDSGALATVCTEARLSELDAGTGGKAANQIDLIKTEADKIALVDAGAGVAGSVIEEVENRATPAQVATELSDALTVDTQTLPGQAAPPVTPTIVEMLSWSFKNFRNKKEQTTSEYRLYDDAGTVIDSKATLSDAAGLTTKEEIVTGP